jgi:hypothetical protein
VGVGWDGAEAHTVWQTGIYLLGGTGAGETRSLLGLKLIPSGRYEYDD